MKIGIIGAGEIGGTLARRFGEEGHDVVIANSRGPETLSALAAATGATPVDVREAVVDRAVIVLAIPTGGVARLPAGLFDGVDPATAVIDTGNYFPGRDGRIASIEDEEQPESRWVEGEIGRPVVKSFNTMDFRPLGSRGLAAGTPGRMAIPVAGDDEAAKRTVMDLIDQIGFDPVDAGSIEESWRQQPDTPVLGANLDADGVRRALAAARPERPERLRG